MRNLRGVMDLVLDVIPEDFESKDSISNQFDWIMKDREFKPPELAEDQWRAFVKVLNTNFIPHRKNRLSMPWICDILSIVNLKPIEQIDSE